MITIIGQSASIAVKNVNLIYFKIEDVYEVGKKFVIKVTIVYDNDKSHFEGIFFKSENEEECNFVYNEINKEIGKIDIYDNKIDLAIDIKSIASKYNDYAICKE